MAAPTFFLYLETLGRRTGLPRRTEIWFVELEGRFYVVAEMREHAQWVRNLRAHDAVAFSVGTRDAPSQSRPRGDARARVIDSADEPELSARVSAAMDAKYDWSDGSIVELSPAAS